MNQTKVLFLICILFLFQLAQCSVQELDEDDDDDLIEEFKDDYEFSFDNQNITGKTIPVGIDRSFQCPSYFGKYKHKSCSKYYHCFYKIPIVMTCIHKFLFDSKAGDCVHWFKAKCKLMDLLPTLPPLPTPIPIPPIPLPTPVPLPPPLG